MSTVRKIAEHLKLAPVVVSSVLKEETKVRVNRKTADKIFKAARKLGYDLQKLKLGKRMEVRRQTIEETLARVAENPAWDRADIVAHLQEALGLVKRVHKRVFKEEYGEDWL